MWQVAACRSVGGSHDRPSAMLRKAASSSASPSHIPGPNPLPPSTFAPSRTTPSFGVQDNTRRGWIIRTTCALSKDSLATFTQQQALKACGPSSGRPGWARVSKAGSPLLLWLSLSRATLRHICASTSTRTTARQDGSSCHVLHQGLGAHDQPPSELFRTEHGQRT